MHDRSCVPDELVVFLLLVLFMGDCTTGCKPKQPRVILFLCPSRPSIVKVGLISEGLSNVGNIVSPIKFDPKYVQIIAMNSGGD